MTHAEHFNEAVTGLNAIIETLDLMIDSPDGVDSIAMRLISARTSLSWVRNEFLEGQWHVARCKPCQDALAAQDEGADWVNPHEFDRLPFSAN